MDIVLDPGLPRLVSLPFRLTFRDRPLPVHVFLRSGEQFHISFLQSNASLTTDTAYCHVSTDDRTRILRACRSGEHLGDAPVHGAGALPNPHRHEHGPLGYFFEVYLVSISVGSFVSSFLPPSLEV
jgi:hypothetical protein